ncbi:MAG TPA: hypothetical protein VLY21_05865 [Nitrososphaerales archaeon]|nr:hypothetical protein [Nitrososphaerales archaeon]
MVSAPAEPGRRETTENAVRSLRRTSRLLEAVTFALIIAVSPASLVFGLGFGISPTDWVNGWVHWVFLLVLLAIAVALLGFAAATDFWLKAERLARRSADAGG